MQPLVSQRVATITVQVAQFVAQAEHVNIVDDVIPYPEAQFPESHLPAPLDWHLALSVQFGSQATQAPPLN